MRSTVETNHTCSCWCVQSKTNKLSLQVYANGIRNIDLQFIIRKLAAPVISVLLLSLCVPYVIAAGVVPAVGECQRNRCVSKSVGPRETPELHTNTNTSKHPFLCWLMHTILVAQERMKQWPRLF